MKCKEHPSYKARRMPLKTTKYPDGCPGCWSVWENAKENGTTDTAIDISPEAARRFVFALQELKRASLRSRFIHGEKQKQSIDLSPRIDRRVLQLVDELTIIMIGLAKDK